MSALAKTEEQILQLWQQDRTFERSIEQREGSKRFVFYDGPPFANGLPHWGGLMTSALKDAVMRYKTMRGYYAPRRFGWDCHGLPPELLAEKEIGVSGKHAIREYGVEKFVNYCRDSVLRFTNEWHDYVVRIGRWVDFADDYRTMDQDYMESVLWAFKELYDKGLIYEGERVVPYSYGAQTALSNFETRQDDSYRDREDLTATIKFRLTDGRTILGWTTTPWTLPSNLLLAVNPKLDYVLYRLKDEELIIAADAVERYQSELENAVEARRFSGQELVGKTYEPLFGYFTQAQHAFRIVEGDFVEAGEGTGVVHIAPGHGEDDYWLGKREDVPIISPVDDEGRFTAEVKDYVGRLVFDANNEIVADLEKQGALFATAVINHKYPHCWRTDVPIIYRAMSAWFVDVPKIKDELLATNQQIHWYPAHMRDGAFGKWLENAREWNISRKRFWGAPLPVWKTDDGEMVVIGSLKELKERAVDPAKVIDLHRPYIDMVEVKTDSGKIARRVEDVFDCWFESGSMPFAQQHYPFENRDNFKNHHPADFITEYVGQTRGWFYTLHVLSTALFGKPAFQHAVAHGIILGSDGRKMSKRLGNYPELADTFARYGADAVRYYLLSSSLFSGETASFDEKALLESQRNVIQRFKNVQTFYSMYAEVDGYQPDKEFTQPVSTNVLDRWILARLSQVTHSVTASADQYDTPVAMRSLSSLIDDLSNWYVRRSRRRFWKSEDDNDKHQAYATLRYCLLTIAQLLAPWSPFVADDVWRSIKGTAGLPDSVHLTDWPELPKPDHKLIVAMSEVRDLITEGLAQRAQAGIKVRQPLASAKVSMPNRLADEFVPIFEEELNVKSIHVSVDRDPLIIVDTKLSDELLREGLARDIVRLIQVERKQAGLEVDDRIDLTLEAEAQIATAIDEFRDFIMQETLALTLEFDTRSSRHRTDHTLADQSLTIGITKSVADKL